MHRQLLQTLYRSSFKRISNVYRVTPCPHIQFIEYSQDFQQPCWIPSSSSEPEVKRDFSKINPDKFGTLSNEPEDINYVLDKMPEEMDDKEEYDIVNDKGKKQRRGIIFYQKLIKKLVAQKRIADAIDVLETRMLKKDKIKPDYYTYNLLINGCAKVGYSEKAFKLYNQMKIRGIKRTAATYTGLFNACAESYFPEQTLVQLNNLRQELSEKGVELNVITYNVMIKAYARLKDVQSAFLVVDEMLDKQFSLQVHTFSSLLQACISDTECGLRHALLTWHKMRAKKVTPDIYIYNLLVRCIRDCEFGDEDELKVIIKRIIAGRGDSSVHMIEDGKSKDQLVVNNGEAEYDQGSNDVVNNAVNDSQPLLVQKPDVTFEEVEMMENRPNLLAVKPHLGSIMSIGSAKTATDRLLLLGGYKNLLKEMENDNVKPDIKTFTQLLSIMPSTSDSEKFLIKEIQKYKVHIDIDFCNMLIKQRALRNDFDGAKAVLNIIQDNFLHPDLITFGVLAMCCRTKYEAQELMSNMRDFSFRLNVEIIGAMVHQACYHFNFEYVQFLMRLTSKMRIQPSEAYMKFLDDLDSRSTDLRRRRKKKDKNLPPIANEVWFLEGSIRFKDYLAQWKKEVTIYKPPHPYKQFKKPRSDEKVAQSEDEDEQFEDNETDKYEKNSREKNYSKSENFDQDGDSHIRSHSKSRTSKTKTFKPGVRAGRSERISSGENEHDEMYNRNDNKKQNYNLDQDCDSRIRSHSSRLMWKSKPLETENVDERMERVSAEENEFDEKPQRKIKFRRKSMSNEEEKE